MLEIANGGVLEISFCFRRALFVLATLHQKEEALSGFNQMNLTRLLFRVCWGVVLCPGGLAVSEAEAAKGRLHLLVFAPDSDRPMAGVSLRCLQRTCGVLRTGRDGGLFVNLKPGTLRLRMKARRLPAVLTPEIPIVEGEVTEVIVSLRRKEGTSQIEVEAAIQRHKIRQFRKIRAQGPRFLVKGRVLSDKTGRGIVGASLFVRGLSSDARTSSKGRFSLLLPRGDHDFSVLHPKYNNTTFRKISISGPKQAPLLFRLKPCVLELQEFVVTAPKIEGSTTELMKQRRQSGTVSEMLGAEEMARTGDSNAGSALKRVSGVTLVGGKFIYVRGLGERYSSTLLNGSSLPSTEPERRVVPLDLFPAGVLEQITLQKTYTPDMPGEFGGGVVKLFTRGFPSKFQASISLSVGVLMGTTFSEGLHVPGDWRDFTGFDFGRRALPSLVLKASQNSPLTERDMFSQNGYTAEELKKFGEIMPNNWRTEQRLVLPDFGISGSIGDRLKWGGATIGYLAYLTYSNGWSQQFPQRDIYILGKDRALELAHQYKFQGLENDVKLAGILVWGVDFNKAHQLRFVTFLNRLTQHEVRSYQGYNRDVGSEIRSTRIRYVEQMLFTQQVRGRHALRSTDALVLDWRYTFSLASRDEPDRREVRFDQEPNQKTLWLLSDRPEGNQRLFSELMDYNHDVSVDLKLPFAGLWGAKSRLQGGFNMMFKQRAVDTRRYKYLHRGPLTGDVRVISKRPEEIFVAENMNEQGFQFGEITRQTDNYSASQRVFSGYLMADLPLGRGFRFTGGARLESSVQSVSTFELFNPDKTPNLTHLSTLDVLPAVLLSWSFNEKMVLRAGFSRTVSRPDFRELSEATFNDVTGGRQVYGNPELKRALLSNVDLRWEWYPRAGETFSLGFFYKNFEKPIESIVVVSAQHSVTFENAEGANNFGVEFDVRKRLGFLHKAFDDFYVAGNVTFVWSRVALSDSAKGIQTSRERPLQGQSPFVVNVQLGYDNVDLGMRFAVLYHVFGQRISEAGALGAPDIYEQPFHQLDLVFGQSFKSGWSLQLKARNLLDLPVRFTQGDKTTMSLTKGRAFELSLGYQF